MIPAERKVTHEVSLPRGQDRLRALIIYVSNKCRSMPRFGYTKLNKIIWQADFDSYAERLIPITGRRYQRLKWGPAAKEMRPLLNELVKNGTIRIEVINFGQDGDGKPIEEQRPVPIDPIDASLFAIFDPEDLKYVDAAIEKHRPKTAVRASKDSHGVAWKTRKNSDPMPYETSFLSDEPLTPKQKSRVLSIIRENGLRTN